MVLSELDTSLAYQNHITSRRWICRNAALNSPHAPAIALARFRNHMWFLYASGDTGNNITDVQRLPLHCFFLHHHHGT